MRIHGTTFTDEGNPVSPKHFAQFLHANVNNGKLSDKEFRQMVRNTLPIVDYVRPECVYERIEGKKCPCTCLHTVHPVANHADGCPEKKS